MSIKSKIRSILGSLVVDDSKIIDKQLLQNVILSGSSCTPAMQLPISGGLLRVWARDQTHATQIIKVLQRHADELSISSLHLADTAIGYMPRFRDEHKFTKSVILKISPERLLKSATSANLLDPNYHASFVERQKQERIVIDYSSPNIAKPFHLGHLKSTILGNYLSNLNEFIGAKVTRLNYIGDWGTQYGLLSLGIDRFKPDILSSISPLKELVDVYIKANQTAKDDEEFHREAKRRFQSLDCDTRSDTDTEILNQWTIIRTISIEELQRSYDTLGIRFDVFEYESDYANCRETIIRKLSSANVLKTLPDGAVVALVRKNNRELEVPVLKSDQTSLYITRDIAAAINRKEKYNFDRLLYVVGADQERHFHSIGELVPRIIPVEKNQLVHVKMGKIKGMSTRSGQFLLLSDIIRETTKRYEDATRGTVTTKTQNEKEVQQVGQQLALSALFVYDMMHGRKVNYDFNWDDVMKMSSRSGLNLQATHARLCSLIKRALQQGIHPSSEKELAIDTVMNVEGLNLLSVLDDFDVKMHSSYHLLDPRPIVDHALQLCRVVNRARQSERFIVSDEPCVEYAQTKLLLFDRVRAQLKLIIKLIGLTPLERI